MDTKPNQSTNDLPFGAQVQILMLQHNVTRAGLAWLAEIGPGAVGYFLAGRGKRPSRRISWALAQLTGETARVAELTSWPIPFLSSSIYRPTWATGGFVRNMLADHLLRRGISLQTVGEFAGCSRQAVHTWLRGRSQSLDVARAIMHLLELTPSEMEILSGLDAARLRPRPGDEDAGRMPAPQALSRGAGP